MLNATFLLLSRAVFFYFIIVMMSEEVERRGLSVKRDGSNSILNAKVDNT